MAQALLESQESILDRFAQLLRYYRQRCTDPERRGKLTQERLGALIGDMIGGAGYTGAAVSDWERGKSQIDKDYRSVLVGLIRIFYACDGLHTLTEANTFLLSGNYRPLDEAETRLLFPTEIPRAAAPSEPDWQMFTLFISQVIYKPAKALRDLSNSPVGIPSRWGGKLLNLLGALIDRRSLARMMRWLAWLGLVALTLFTIFPMLVWPFDDRAQAYRAVIIYAGAAMLLPLGIGLLTDTRRDEFWRAQNLPNNPTLRFYTYLGATVGFHVSYFMLFVLALTTHYLGFSLTRSSLRIVLAFWPVLLGAAAAQQIPFNHWRAYGRLNFSDGAIFSVFYLFGPLWAGYFYFFHTWLVTPLTGIPITITVIICLTALSALRRHKKQEVTVHEAR